jgi:hypothetical protein
VHTSLVSTVTCTEAAAATSPVEAALLVATLHLTWYEVPLGTPTLKKLAGRVSTSPDCEVVEPVRGVASRGLLPAAVPTWLGSGVRGQGSGVKGHGSGVRGQGVGGRG